MALLSKSKREQYFKSLKLGEYNKDNILKFQKEYFPHYTKGYNNWTGKYDANTDILLRHVYNVYKHTKNFKPKEFVCGCGNKYCNGYPTYMRKNILVNIQSIRTHFNKKITITCGLRCDGYNRALNGSVVKSKHLSGKAVDFYQVGVTDTLANRKKSIKYIKKLDNHNYTYGNGINSNGATVNAPNMGNALHTEVK